MSTGDPLSDSTRDPLHDPWFRDLFRTLHISDLAGQLPGTPLTDAPSLSNDELMTLLSYASLFALDDRMQSKAAAYEITTRLVELFGSQMPGLFAAADLILSRLGNFPGRTLLRQRYGKVPNSAPQAPPRLALERLAREIENTIEGPAQEPVCLTDFQHTLFTALGASPSVSVSAPTSAGKSFVLGIDLARRLKSESPECVVYIVPTRALIREVTFLLRHHLRNNGLGDVPVRSVPFPIAPDDAPRGAVYVLTQERLMSLLHSREGSAWITSLIVDEAQAIRDDARGVILQSAVEAVLIRFPTAEVHFASPLVKNPEFLLGIFQRQDSGTAFVEDLSPVSQNLILVAPVRRKPAQVDCQQIGEYGPVDLGRRVLPFKMNSGSYKSRADFARAITRDDESTILYANDPQDAEALSGALCTDATRPDNVDSDIRELIEFVQQDIHPEYPLIRYLPYGVAYHYGYMPALVRSRIEDLCKAGKIKYVCCTSTLLQGVNLPARHIIIENPKRGAGKPMERRDFLNLAGRAGRLLKEFHGNVWCIRPDRWDEKSYEGERLQKIGSAVDAAMADGGIIVQGVLSNSISGRDLDYGEATFGKLYCDYIKSDRDLRDSPWKTAENASALAQTAGQLEELRITLPAEVLDANRSVRPDRLQQLYERLLKDPDPASLVPVRPRTAGANDRMGAIIQMVQETLGGVDNNSYLFYKWLAVQWIHNVPLSVIIQQRIDYLRSQGNGQSVSAAIRGLLKTLEEAVRFRLVKYFMAYNSVLGLVLKERGHRAVAEELEPFHVYLECGASDRAALNLIALGLSRSTALALSGRIRFEDDATPETCLAKLTAINLQSLSIPSLCIREVQDLLGRA